MKPDYTQTHRLSFDEESYGARQPWVIHHRGLEHKGEVIVAEAVEPWLGQPLERGLSFRIVFFTTPRRIPFDRIRDPRIAMAVPLRLPDEISLSINRQIKGVRETAAKYSTSTNPDIRALNSPLERQQASLQEELGHAYKAPYSRGRIYTQSGFTIRPRDIYAEDGPESWANQLAGAVITQAVPDLPFDYNSLPYTLTDERIVSLYEGLFQGRRDSDDLVRDFGPGLHLTSEDSLTLFDASESTTLSIIREAIESHGGEMPAQDMLETLAFSHGLSRQLAALYLITFVRQNHAEIELVRGHKVAKYKDGPFLGGSITRDVVPEIAFDESLIDYLGTIRLEPAQSWNTALPYASLIVEGLGPADDDDSIAEQEQRLLDGLGNIASRAPDVKEGLQSLEAEIGSSSPTSQKTLDSLEELAAASSYGEFYSTAQRVFGEPGGLSDTLVTYNRLGQLADLSSNILELKGYLDGMGFGRDHQNLELERNAFVARIDLNSLMSDPSVWRSLEEETRLFRARYASVYISHHTQYHQEALELRNRLEGVAPQVQAIARFNEMPELGEPVGDDVAQLFKNVSSALRVCHVREDDLSLDDVPYCQRCLLSLDVDVPRFDAETLFGAIERAMRVYNRRLGYYSARRVLAHPSKEQLDKFTNLVQVADPSALVNVLDDEVIEFLRQFLRNGQ